MVTYLDNRSLFKKCNNKSRILKFLYVQEDEVYHSWCSRKFVNPHRSKLQGDLVYLAYEAGELPRKHTENKTGLACTSIHSSLGFHKIIQILSICFIQMFLL